MGMNLPVAREFADYGIKTGWSLGNGRKIGAKNMGGIILISQSGG